MSETVITATGEVDPDELGFTLMHEHLVTQFWHAPHRFDLAGMPEDPKYILAELAELRDRGGRTIVDVTPIGLNRDPVEVRRLSEVSGIQVVLGCGWYRDSYFPAEARIERRSVDDLAAELVHEIRHGIGESGVRPGIVGEVGTEKPWVSPTEERVHRAAARAAAATGLAVMTHSFASPVGTWQLELLVAEGVDAARVVIGHADTYRDRAYHHALLEQGATIEFDTLMWYRPQLLDDALDLIAEYVAEGWGAQLLVSLDTCKAEHLKRFGGRGLSAAHEVVLPGLARRGLSDTDVHNLFVQNPRRILTVKDG